MVLNKYEQPCGRGKDLLSERMMELALPMTVISVIHLLQMLMKMTWIRMRHVFMFFQ
jgi:hypothetical protein